MKPTILEHLLDSTKPQTKPYKPQYDDVIYELVKRGYAGHTIHKYICRAYGNKALARDTVYARVKSIKAKQARD
jgi:hypothetical protein